MTTHRPDYIPYHGGLYRFDRIAPDQVAWFTDLRGVSIPSAPRVTSVALVGHGNGHASHGNGHGYGHDRHTTTPEPSAFWCLMVALALFTAGRIMAWRRG